MLEKLWKFANEQDNLVREARRRSVAMLRTTHEMFHSVIHAVSEGKGAGHRSRVADKDKEINREQREVRKMVFEHLALAQGRDIAEGLRLVTVVIDIERIGDLSKNIEELFGMMAGGIDADDQRRVFGDIERIAREVFDLTLQAFEHNDADVARRAIARYDELATHCESYFREVLSETREDDCVRRADLGLVLLLRYVKRTGGHLKNIASAVVNPFDRIGFREGVG